MTKTNTINLTLCAFFAALLAVCSQIQIPLPMIPINLALFAVYLAATVLGSKRGTLAVLVFLILGIIGVPVFAGFKGGPAVLFGKTGGYLAGYLFTAFFTGFLCEQFGYQFWKLCLFMAIGLLTCYVFGTIWFMKLSGNPLALSLSYCVLPFLPGDAVKIGLAAALTKPVRERMPKL